MADSFSRAAINRTAVKQETMRRISQRIADEKKEQEAKVAQLEREYSNFCAKVHKRVMNEREKHCYLETVTYGEDNQTVLFITGRYWTDDDGKGVFLHGPFAETAFPPSIIRGDAIPRLFEDLKRHKWVTKVVAGPIQYSIITDAFRHLVQYQYVITEVSLPPDQPAVVLARLINQKEIAQFIARMF